jgi:predicted phage terminase large subunit-like protein
MEGTYFKENWIQEYDDLPENMIAKYDLRVWTGVDLAISDKEENDEFAIVTIGVTPKSFEVYVLDYLSGRYTINQQKHLVGNVYEEWKPLRIFIESNAYQAALAGAVQDLFPHIPTMKVFTTKDKVTRALSIQPYYERGKVYHRKGRMRRLTQQLIGFPNHKLKDLFDALFFAFNGALQKGARKQRTRELKLF